jgi:hypothetical protein
MNLPFTTDEFFQVFRRYNTAVAPAQIALFALGVFVAALSLWRPQRSSRFLSAALAFLWIWMAIVYHWMFFSQINPAARIFAATFAVEGVLFVWIGLVNQRLEFESGSPPRRTVSLLLFVYALVVYPVLGHLGGHRYPALPTFGLPCPTTILTLGVLCLGRPPAVWWALAIPLTWSVVGSFAAFRLGVPQDLGLSAAAVLTLSVVLSRTPASSRTASVRR